MIKTNAEAGKQFLHFLTSKKWHFFFQHCLRNPSAKDETVKLYRRPRYFTHPAWMRVSGLIWEEHVCATCVYEGKLFRSLLSSVKACADVQVSLIWIQLNAECLLVSEGGCKTEIHQGTRSQICRALCSSGNYEGIFTGCQNCALLSMVIVPGKLEDPKFSYYDFQEPVAQHLLPFSKYV